MLAVMVRASSVSASSMIQTIKACTARLPMLAAVRKHSGLSSLFNLPLALVWKARLQPLWSPALWFIIRNPQ